MKRGIAMVLSAALFVSNTAVSAYGLHTLSVTDTEQKCGDQITWTLTDGTLELHGSGAMYDYIDTPVPWDYTKVKSIEVADGIQSIGSFAFADCLYLTEVSIAESVESIGSGAFNRCKALESITLPSKIRTVAPALFMECTNLKEVHWKANVSVIGASAFFNCSALQAIDLSGVRIVREEAFYHCSNLRTITIPSSVTRIETQAFGTVANQTENSKTIIFEGTAPDVANDAFANVAVTATYPEASWKEIPSWGGSWTWRTAHNMVYMPPTQENCEQDGFRGYWKCRNASCSDKYFADEAGTQEVSKESIVIKAGQHEWEEQTYDPCTAKEIRLECKICHKVKTEPRTASHVPKEKTEEIIEVPERLDATGICDEVVRCSVCNAEISRVQKELRYDVRLSNKRYIYSGETCEPNVTIFLGGKEISHTLYEVSYKDHMNAGTATATITAKPGNILNGSIVCSYVIEPRTIADQTATLKCDSYTYNGRNKKPAVLIDGLVENRDFTVAYQNARKVGRGRVLIRGIGNYCGELQALSFVILPKAPAWTELTAAKKKLTVTWEQQTKQVNGYQISYARKKDFSDEVIQTVVGKRKHTTVLKQLRAKKRYHVRIRSYKRAGDGQEYYSAWSAVQSMKSK